MKIYIAADHAGFELKQNLINHFKQKFNFIDLGPQTTDRVDYPDFANLVAENLKKDPQAMGILICGSGQGMAMRANKYSHIRAALCWDKESCMLSRQHNDANVLCLGSRLLPMGTVYEIMDTFFATEFEGGRHADRVNKISNKDGLC